jgi:hypothetical protein
MKKLLTLLATFAVALSMTMPAYAKHAKKSKDSEGKAHQPHSKKKNKKGMAKAEGQEGVAPGQEKK